MTQNPPRPLIVALTGGIGSGKSAAADHFKSLGADVIDTDAISHALTAPGGKAIPPIATRFGSSVLRPDGGLDRTILREIVFKDAAQRKSLEHILHPMIRTEVSARIQASRAPYAMVVVPLLVETGAYADLYQRIVVVDCEEETQISRTMTRSQLTRDQVLAIMQAQASRASRLAKATDIIRNEGTLADLHSQVVRLHEHFVLSSQAGSA